MNFQYYQKKNNSIIESMNKVSSLYQAICDFRGAQGTTGNSKIDSLSKEFEEAAKAAFYTGYFLVNIGDEKYEY